MPQPHPLLSIIINISQHVILCMWQLKIWFDLIIKTFWEFEVLYGKAEMQDYIAVSFTASEVTALKADMILWWTSLCGLRISWPCVQKVHHAKKKSYMDMIQKLLSKLNALWQNGKLHKTSLMVLKCTSAYEKCVLCSWKGSINAKWYVQVWEQHMLLTTYFLGRSSIFQQDNAKPAFYTVSQLFELKLNYLC